MNVDNFNGIIPNLGDMAWIVWRGSRPNDVDGAFLQYHRDHNTPYVRIMRRRGKSDVMLSCVNYPFQLDSIGRIELEEIVTQAGGCSVEGLPGDGLNLIFRQVQTNRLNDFGESLFRFALRFGLRTGRIHDKVQRVVVTEIQRPPSTNKGALFGGGHWWVAPRPDGIGEYDCRVMLEDGRWFKYECLNKKPAPSAEMVRTWLLLSPGKFSELKAGH